MRQSHDELTGAHVPSVDALPGAMTFHPWVSLVTLFRRESMRYLRLPIQTIAAPFLSNLLFLGVFGGFAAARSNGLHGPSAVAFLVPGLVVSGAFMSAFQNPVFSILSMKYADTLKELRYVPLGPSLRLMAFAAAGALRGLLVAVMTWAAAGLIAGYGIRQPLFFWAFILALSLVAAAGGVAFGLRLASFDKANFLVGLVLTPAMYLGGVFYDIAQAGPVLGTLARFSPFTAPVGLARLLYGGAASPQGLLGISFAAALAVFFMVFSWRSLASGAGMMTD